MTAAPSTALEAAFACARELERRSIPYAIGGALAYGVWSNPRNTNDVDLNVFVELDGLDPAFEALEAAGVTIDRVRARREAAQRGMFVGHLGPFRVDAFVPSTELSREAEATRRRVVVGTEEFDFLSAEVITLFKLMFFRGKDRVDLERLVATHGALDREYVRRHLVEMFDEADERVRFWDDLVTELPP